MGRLPYPLVDTHAHLDELEHPDAAVEEARQAGLAGIVAVGMSYESNHRVLELADKHSGFVHAALGLHPWQVAGESQALDRSLGFIEDNLGRAVAVGEVGLDYDKRVRALAGKEVQQEVLRQLLALANKHDKPVSLHNRYAWPDCVRLARESGASRVVFHWYTGFSSALDELLTAGYYISATPAAEYHHEHRRAVREVPLSRLLLETDCPVEYGRVDRWRSAPRDVGRTLRAVAEVRGLAETTVARQTTGNAADFFGLDIGGQGGRAGPLLGFGGAP